jgi:hypothetical protein
MKNLLNANLKIWHLLLVFLVIALSSGGVVLAAEPLGVSSFFPKGEFYMAGASGSGGSPVTVPSDGTEVTVLSATFTVPSGKKADVAALFNGDALWNGSTPGYCRGEIRLDSPTGTAFLPGSILLVDGYVYSYNGNRHATLDMNAYKKAIGAGAHTAYVRMWTEEGGSGCLVYARSLMLVANVR